MMLNGWGSYILIMGIGIGQSYIQKRWLEGIGMVLIHREKDFWRVELEGIGMALGLTPRVDLEVLNIGLDCIRNAFCVVKNVGMPS
jgi:hypothetical protein